MAHLSSSFTDEQTLNSEETPSSWNNTEEQMVSECDTGNMRKGSFMREMVERAESAGRGETAAGEEERNEIGDTCL